MSLAVPARTRRGVQPSPPTVVPRRARRVRPRRMSAGGAVWVVVLAALLGGSVALNVAALRDSIEVNRLQGHARELSDANRLLQNRVTNLSSPGAIGIAAQKLGMRLADPNTTRYVGLHAPRHTHGRP